MDGGAQQIKIPSKNRLENIWIFMIDKIFCFTAGTSIVFLIHWLNPALISRRIVL
jgi:hypothetical protein